MSLAALTAIGTVAAGLALPLAFAQLAALRQDRLRAQISKVGVWYDLDWPESGTPRLMAILFVRNASELPVELKRVELNIDGKPRISIDRGFVPPDETRKWEIGAGDPSEIALGEVSIIDATRRLWDLRPIRGGPARRIRLERWWLWRRDHGVRLRHWWLRHRRRVADVAGRAGRLIKFGDEG
jgi:hypothetical protein